jgi:hypothetical protein
MAWETNGSNNGSLRFSLGLAFSAGKSVPSPASRPGMQKRLQAIRDSQAIYQQLRRERLKGYLSAAELEEERLRLRMEDDRIAPPEPMPEPAVARPSRPAPPAMDDQE